MQIDLWDTKNSGFMEKILTYLGFQNNSSVFIIFLPVSVQDMSDSCFHTDKEDPSSLLLTHSIPGGMWNKSCTPCSVLKAKACQDSRSWAEPGGPTKASPAFDTGHRQKLAQSPDTPCSPSLQTGVLCP